MVAEAEKANAEDLKLKTLPNCRQRLVSLPPSYFLYQRRQKLKILERSLQSYMSEIAPFNDFLEEGLVVEPEGFITGGRAIPKWNDW